MEKLIKVDNESYPELYNKEIDKYIYVNSNNDILGLVTIDDSKKANKIKINVMEEFQGNGHGKTIFKRAIDLYREKYNDCDLRFEIRDESRLNSIISELGGVNIANNNGIMVYILPIKQ